MRVKILRVIVSFFFIITGVNLFCIQIIRGQHYYNLSVNNRIRVVSLQERRGRIIDRNGVILAENRPSYDVTVIPQDIKDKPALFAFLSKVLKMSEETLMQEFSQKRLTPFTPVVIAPDVDKTTAMILEENKFRFPGLHIQETFTRHYPFMHVGAHILGHVGKVSFEKMEEADEYGYTPQSIIGYSGIEAYYDSYLRGKPGGLQIEVDSRGRQVQLLSLKEAVSGEDIQLTIDQRIQETAAAVLGEKPGVIIVMDLESGEILGMVSSPAYDPNTFTSANLKKNIGQLHIDKAAPLLNRAIQGLYPPGSCFKPIMAMAGLDTGKVHRNTSYTCGGFFQLGRRRFHCVHIHGLQNLVEALQHSCNVYFFNVGDNLGPDLIHKYARMFGLGSLTHIDLPFEEQGVVPSRLGRKMENQGWYRGDTLNISIGQGDTLVTPIQLVRMMTAVARSGRDVQPHLIKTIGSKSIVKFSTIRNIHLAQQHFEIVQEALRLAVGSATGTARSLDLEGLRVSGKTGTAQSTKGKNEHAWFVGYETQGKTKIAFCVFLEHGGSSYYACQAGRELLELLREKEIL